jgi:hypothetical protein
MAGVSYRKRPASAAKVSMWREKHEISKRRNVEMAAAAMAVINNHLSAK